MLESVEPALSFVRSLTIEMMFFIMSGLIGAWLSMSWTSRNLAHEYEEEGRIQAMHYDGHPERSATSRMKRQGSRVWQNVLSSLPVFVPFMLVSLAVLYLTPDDILAARPFQRLF